MSISIRPIATALAAGIAATLCITAATAPAMAQDDTTSSSIVAQVDKQAPNKVCIAASALGQPSTGTVLKRRLCKTPEQWAAEGITLSSRDSAPAGTQTARK
jgi:hypothetical protein